jgi:hypothetical protein
MIKLTLNPNTGKEDQVEGLIGLCCTRADIQFTLNKSKIQSTEEIEYELLTSSVNDAKMFVYEWFYALSLPDHEFTDVVKSEVQLESEQIQVTNCINTNMQRSLNYDIDLLDMVVSDVAFDQESVKERLTAIEQYIQKSGIIYYQQFMKELVEVLDAREILDKESVIAKMFNTIH